MKLRRQSVVLWLVLWLVLLVLLVLLLVLLVLRRWRRLGLEPRLLGRLEFHAWRTRRCRCHRCRRRRRGGVCVRRHLRLLSLWGVARWCEWLHLLTPRNRLHGAARRWDQWRVLWPVCHQGARQRCR